MHWCTCHLDRNGMDVPIAQELVDLLRSALLTALRLEPIGSDSHHSSGSTACSIVSHVSCVAQRTRPCLVSRVAPMECRAVIMIVYVSPDVYSLSGSSIGIALKRTRGCFGGIGLGAFRCGVCFSRTGISLVLAIAGGAVSAVF